MRRLFAIALSLALLAGTAVPAGAQIVRRKDEKSHKGGKETKGHKGGKETPAEKGGKVNAEKTANKV